ncbi:MAG: hypothetical protein ACI9TP_000270 [Candidatus Azotimanducaceae bacterium]|jgi:hypothetical protein
MNYLSLSDQVYFESLPVLLATQLNGRKSSYRLAIVDWINGVSSEQFGRGYLVRVEKYHRVLFP